MFRSIGAEDGRESACNAGDPAFLGREGSIPRLERSAAQAPLSMGFSRQDCWSELPFPHSGLTNE